MLLSSKAYLFFLPELPKIFPIILLYSYVIITFCSIPSLFLSFSLSIDAHNAYSYMVTGSYINWMATFKIIIIYTTLLEKLRILLVLSL